MTRRPAIRFTDPADRQMGLLTAMDDKASSSQLNEWMLEDQQKLHDLCVHYGIPNNEHMYYLLALELAREFLPKPKTGGNHKKWTDFAGACLVTEIDRLANENKITKSSAANALSNEAPWKNFLDTKSGSYMGSDPTGALLQAYKTFKKKPLTRATKDCYKYYKLTDDISGWKNMLLSIKK